jgi:NDP-4-keto-2,6-dideoxyhexose 3-C-methyltransferase
MDFGSYLVSDFPDPDDAFTRIKYSLDLYLDEEINAPRLREIVPSDQMYGSYWYRSGINTSMPVQLNDIVTEITSRVKHDVGDIWLDIACNDGTMFKSIPHTYAKFGIDPADESYTNEAGLYAYVVQDFFNKDTFFKMSEGVKARVITCIAMFYDVEDPHAFLRDVRECLHDDGTFVLQMSYTPLMVKQLAFDNICHEHVYYYALTDIKKLMEMNGFRVVDCSLNDTNGGSFRVHVQKDTAPTSTYGTKPIRDVAEVRVNSILEWETHNYFPERGSYWDDFKDNMEDLKTDVVSFIKAEVAKGKTVYGYGASTKGNTLLQYFGLDSTLITAIAERSPYKYGRVTVGTHIPIIPEAEMRASKPDYLLILPWHFISEFTERESDFLEAGGKFIVPCPTFEVIGK